MLRMRDRMLLDVRCSMEVEVRLGISIRFFKLQSQFSFVCLAALAFIRVVLGLDKQTPKL